MLRDFAPLPAPNLHRPSHAISRIHSQLIRYGRPAVARCNGKGAHPQHACKLFKKCSTITTHSRARIGMEVMLFQYREMLPAYCSFSLTSSVPSSLTYQFTLSRQSEMATPPSPSTMTREESTVFHTLRLTDQERKDLIRQKVLAKADILEVSILDIICCISVVHMSLLFVHSAQSALSLTNLQCLPEGRSVV